MIEIVQTGCTGLLVYSPYCNRSDSSIEVFRTYNHTHMTAVPTRLLLDTNLSAEAKLTGALLYTFEDGGLSTQELANALTLPPEKVAPVFAELTGNGYLEILEENGAFGLHLKG